MFSNLTKKLHDGLEAVENSVAAVATSPTTGSQSATDIAKHSERASTLTTQHTYSSSGDHHSSSSLAEGALSSIRRSFALQRATGGSPTSNDPLSRSKSPPPSNSRELSPVTKRAGSTGSSRLEERLRASLNKGTTVPSRPSTPNPESQTPSESPVEAGPSETIPLPHARIHQKATPSTILGLDPVTIPLPPSPQLVPAAPYSPTSESPASDPLTPNLTAFDVAKALPSRASSSKTVLESHPALHAAAASPLLPSFLPSAAALAGDAIPHSTNSDTSNVHTQPNGIVFHP